MSNSAASQYPCPYCNDAPLETSATAPYVRGFLVAYQIGTKSFMGCNSCVQKKMRGEAGKSLLLGWFSLVAFFLNPFMILYNLLRSFFISPNPEAVAKKLRELGLPDNPQVIDIQSVGFALAAAMILADGVVEESELLAAEKAGDEVFGEFDEAALRMIVQHGKDLPPVEDLAAMLTDVLDDEAKEKVMIFLAEIAMADGNVAPEERLVLEKVGQGLGVTSPMA
ncbi:MAG: TerB family tellurite resistance protein [Mariniblastus sp.]